MICSGTMGQDTERNYLENMGALHKITKPTLNKPTTVLSLVNISNGLAWNKANDKFYYIDSKSFQIAEFDYDNLKGIRTKTLTNHFYSLLMRCRRDQQ